jgi:hypothetical protein
VAGFGGDDSGTVFTASSPPAAGCNAPGSSSCANGGTLVELRPSPPPPLPLSPRTDALLVKSALRFDSDTPVPAFIVAAYCGGLRVSK